MNGMHSIAETVDLDRLADLIADRLAGHAPLGLTIEGAAAASGLGRTTLFREIKAGRLTAAKVGGRTVVLRSDLEAFLNDRRVTG